MKKLVALLAVIVMCQGAIMAQKAKPVQEKDVPERYVKDFHKKAPDCQNAVWTLVDSNIYDATFSNGNDTKTSYRFSPKGTETRWFIDSKYYPHAVKDTVAAHYPKYKISELYVLQIKNKTTYQARIAKKAGLFGRKEKSPKLLNFETDGKFIDEVEIR